MSSSAITPPSSPPPAKRQRTDKENTPTNDNTTTSKINEMTKPFPFTTPPSTPPRSYSHPPIPPTPSHHKFNQPAFPGENIDIENDLAPIQFSGPLSSIPVYKDQQRVKHNVFQQPPGSKSCWAYSLAMLLTDIIRKEQSLQLDDSFWGWFQGVYLLNAETIQKKANELDVSLKLTKIPNESPLKHIRGKIEESGFPVLTTIEHPEFSGHTIVVDKVTEEETTIRDPYSGLVFVIPNERMKQYYNDAFFGMENCLSVITQPAN